MEVIDAVREPESSDKGLKPDAAGDEDDRRTVSGGLQRAPQPAQEVIHAIGVAVPAQDAGEEDRQFVDGNQDRTFVLRARLDELVPMSRPVAGVQGGAHLEAEAKGAGFLEAFAEPSADTHGGTSRKAGVGMEGFGKVRNDVLGTEGAFYIEWQERPPIGLKTPAEFSKDAGLSHTALAGEKHMIAVPNQRVQLANLGVSVEKVVAGNPPTS